MVSMVAGAEKEAGHNVLRDIVDKLLAIACSYYNFEAIYIDIITLWTGV